MVLFLTLAPNPKSKPAPFSFPCVLTYQQPWWANGKSIHAHRLTKLVLYVVLTMQHQQRKERWQGLCRSRTTCKGMWTSRTWNTNTFKYHYMHAQSVCYQKLASSFHSFIIPFYAIITCNIWPTVHKFTCYYYHVTLKHFSKWSTFCRKFRNSNATPILSHWKIVSLQHCNKIIQYTWHATMLKHSSISTPTNTHYNHAYTQFVTGSDEGTHPPLHPLTQSSWRTRSGRKINSAQPPILCSAGKRSCILQLDLKVVRCVKKQI